MTASVVIVNATVEATPVQEIIATEVITMPSNAIPTTLDDHHPPTRSLPMGANASSNVPSTAGGNTNIDDRRHYSSNSIKQRATTESDLNIEQVDFDDTFRDDDDGADDEHGGKKRITRTIKPHQYVVTVLVLVIYMAIICFIIFGLIVNGDTSSGHSDDHNVTEDCSNMIQSALHHLEYLRGKALVSYVLGLTVLSVRIFQCSEHCQRQKRCSLPLIQEHDTSTNYGYIYLILFVLELFWVLLTAVILICLGMESKTPGDDILDACQDDDTNTRISKATTLGPYMGSVGGSMPLLIGVVISKGRHVLMDEECESKSRVRLIVVMVLEGIVLILSGLGSTYILPTALRAVQTTSLHPFLPKDRNWADKHHQCTILIG